MAESRNYGLRDAHWLQSDSLVSVRTFNDWHPTGNPSQLPRREENSKESQPGVTDGQLAKLSSGVHFLVLSQL